LALLIGLLALFLGVNATWHSYEVGKLIFTYRHQIATGPLAAFGIGACLAIGLYLVGSSVRNLQDP
jgi:hypothetical protein